MAVSGQGDSDSAWFNVSTNTV